MSPGDFKLIAKGVARGSLVQFDRGSLDKLKTFMEEHAKAFAGMKPQFAELQAAEETYRSSLPDVTHNGLRLLYSGQLWSTIFASAVTGWRVCNLLDDSSETRLRQSRIKTFLFFLLGMIPLLGGGLRKWTARADWRRHYQTMLSNWAYLKKALHGKAVENVIKWHRAGRVTAARAQHLAAHAVPYICHLPFSLLPVGLHRTLTDAAYAKERLAYLFVRPIRLYFNADKRRQWMEQMLVEGQGKHMLTEEDAQTITTQLDEPYIQKYLVSLVVHLMTLPVTQVVSLAHMGIWNMMHAEALPAERAGMSLFILWIYQVIPISPGSFCRGIYTTIMAIRDRNFNDYNIALFLSYFKYVGYLAFPIQMTYHYPALARFMAGHWATEAVHMVPVFGERGALLERWVFNLFYNWPLTIRKRMSQRARIRDMHAPRYWHIVLCSLTAAAALGWADKIGFDRTEQMPSLKDLWWLVIGAGYGCGALVTLACRGATLGQRILSATLSGFLSAAAYTYATVAIAASAQIHVDGLWIIGVWRVFVLVILTVLGTLLTEIQLPYRE